MNYNNNDDDMWDWRCNEYSLEDNASLDLPKCLFGGEGPSEDLSYMLDDETTPVKACGDLAYHVNASEKSCNEMSQYKEAPSQVKRRRTLQFEPGDLEAPFCNKGNSSLFLRSKEAESSMGGSMAEMTEWVSGFAEVGSASCNEVLDPSSEGWLADCFNDAEMQISSDDFNSSSTSDVHINITDLCDTPPEHEVNAMPLEHEVNAMPLEHEVNAMPLEHEVNAMPLPQQQPVRTRRNVVFKGKKSIMRSPPKLASSVVYPFAFVKPCGVHGDVTLKDINQKIRDPPPKAKETTEDLAGPYPTSAFSGKPVVGKTKIRTEGGKGSITIMRTKG